MAKVKKEFICNECGHSSPKWVGKCPSCNSWNTYTEEIIYKDTEKPKSWTDNTPSKTKPRLIDDIETGTINRIISPDNELNRVLGGGIVPGSIILIGGQPGIGKSTLMLQSALALNYKILYVSGEESEEQIKMHSQRIKEKNVNLYILSETNLSKILRHAKEMMPKILVIDSIQTLSSPLLDSTPGSVSQIRECAAELQRFSKMTGIAVFMIGHITKDGSIAGPKLLEHIVDVVLQFEGDRNYTYRILRTIKNRFGSTDEMGIYQMQSDGLRQVENPSELLLSQKDPDLSGSAIAATIEGMRPMLIEVQALVSAAVFGTPQRSATGFEIRRLNMLLAVLEKRAGFIFGQSDVFLNIAGGIKVNDPAIDLSIISALISSYEDIDIPPTFCFAGEVGLSGEIRAVNRIDQRIQEADRLGFKKIFISKYNRGITPEKYNIEVIKISKIQELYRKVFED